MNKLLHTDTIHILSYTRSFNNACYQRKEYISSKNRKGNGECFHQLSMKYQEESLATFVVSISHFSADTCIL